MADRVFVDTNVLLRMFHDTLPLHHQCLASVEQFRDVDAELWINRQVIREYLVTVTRPGTFTIPLSMEQISMQIETVNTLFKIADETEAVTRQLLQLLRTIPTLGKQVHDANIVATMLVHGIDTLLTINVDDMKRFNNLVKVVSPHDFTQ